MKPLTLYRAHIATLDEMSSIMRQRGGSLGIAVNYDYYALVWQRRQRLAEKLRWRVELALGFSAPKHAQGPRCVICGHVEGHCRCENGFRPAARCYAAQQEVKDE